MANAAQALLDMKRTSDFLVCVDSDGCAFDTMEIKHKESFIPHLIDVYNLQAVSTLARETWEFVNLYSKTRGCNRFPGVVKTIDLLEKRPEAIRRGFKKPDIESLRNWCETESKLGNPALIAYCEAHPEDEEMKKALRWTTEVNETIKRMVHDVPPFPNLRECFEKMKGKVDIIVVSQASNDALEREWSENDLTKYVTVVCGQEMGTKAQCIELAKKQGYKDDHVLMIGDAPGDCKAAKSNGVLWYPINPGQEEDSWKKLFDEAFDKFMNLEYKGAYEDSLIEYYESLLPAIPPWENK